MSIPWNHPVFDPPRPQPSDAHFFGSVMSPDLWWISFVVVFGPVLLLLILHIPAWLLRRCRRRQRVSTKLPVMLPRSIWSTTQAQKYVPPPLWPITSYQAGDTSDNVATNAGFSTDGGGEKLIPPTPAVTKNGLGGFRSKFKLGGSRQRLSALPIQMTALGSGESFKKLGRPRTRQQSSALPIHMDGADSLNRMWRSLWRTVYINLSVGVVSKIPYRNPFRYTDNNTISKPPS